MNAQSSGEPVDPEEEEECGYSWDHTLDDPDEPTHCLECGADLSGWGSSDDQADD